jgi:hypothetical protein
MALHFNETDQYLTIGDDDVLTLPDGDWTIACWVKLDDNVGSLYQYFLSWGTWSATPSLNWYFIEHSVGGVGDELKFSVEDNDGTLVEATSSGEPGTSTDWQHLLMSRSGNTVTQYINGVANGDVTNAAFDAVNRSDAMNIGRRVDNTRFFGGALEWLAKWDRALPEAERNALAAGASAFRFPDELSWVAPMRWDVANDEFWKRSDGGIWTRLSTNAYGSPTLVDGPPVENQNLCTQPPNLMVA